MIRLSTEASDGHGNVWFPQDRLTGIEGDLHVDQALVRTSPEEQVGVAQTLHEGPVDQHVELVQQFPLVVMDECLKGKTRETPDILIRIGMDGACQIGEARCLIHRVATREGDVGKGIVDDDLQQLLCRHLAPLVELPRLGVMTAWALVVTTSAIDGGPESRTVHHRIFYDIKNPYHFSLFTFHYSLFPKHILCTVVDMGHAVVELGQLATVPAVGRTHEIARDALQLVDVRRAALRTLLQMVVGILVATVHAAVAVVVHGAVAHVELVHHIHDAHDHLRVVGSVAVDLHIEDVTAAGHLMIGCLDLGLMTGRALVIDGHVVGVRIVVTIGHTGDDAKLLAVLLRELAAQALCRRCQHGVVMMILVAEVVDALAHVAHDLQSQLLRLLTLTVVLASQGHQTLGQTDEADAQRALVDDALDGVGRLQLVSTDPETLHQQRELLGEGRLLELETVVELLGGHLQHVVELGEEHVDALLLVGLIHALDGELDDVDGREREVTTSDRGLRTEAVLEHTGTTAHRGHLVDVALRIVGTPVAVLVERGVEVQEVGEEPARCHLACQLVEVEVTVLGQIVHATLLLPDLDGEDGSLATADALVGREQDLTHHATALGTRVRTIVDRREHHLVTATRMDGVHIVDEGLHRLMHAAHGLVDGVLLGALLARQSVEGLLDVVHQRLVVEVLVALAVQFLQRLEFLDIRHAHVGCQVEVEGGDGLTTMHLVLGALHRDTGQHRCGLDALRRARGTVAGDEAAVQDVVQRMLHAGQRLGRIVVLVVYVQVVVLHGIATLLAQQIVVDEGFRRLRGKLHHHAGRGVGIHVGVFARDIIIFDVHDVQEHVARLGLAGDAALVAVGDVLLGHILAARLHQLHLHRVLYLLHRHLTVATLGDVIGNLIQQALILTLVGVKHSLTDGSHDLLLIKSHNASVTLYYCLNHI